MQTFKKEIGIRGTGYCLPQGRLPNEVLEKQLGFSADYIEKIFGVKERRVVDRGKQPFSDLALVAAKDAIRQSQINNDEIDLIVVSAGSSDYFIPKVGAYIQEELNIKNAHVINIQAACGTFNYALGVSWRYLRNGMYKNALLVMGDTPSVAIEPGEHLIAGFGDAASCAVLSPLKDGYKGILADDFNASGEFWDAMYIKSPGSAHPLSEDAINNKLHFCYYKEDATNVIMPSTINWFKECFENCIAKANVEFEDVELFSPHPVTGMQIEAQLESLNVPKEKCQIVTDRIGHSSSGTALIVLQEAESVGKLSPGKIAYSFGVGGGFHWGGTLIKWCSRDMFE